MSIYSTKANWVKNPGDGTCSFNKTNFKKVQHFIVNNAYFEVGNKILRQNIGIPMGTDPAPFYANADLYYCEFKFQEKYTRTNYKVAKSLNHTFRYIDDISPFNDKGNFKRYIPEIYRPELELNKENVGNQQASVLEIDISVKEGKFITGVYDKRDDFTFKVSRFPSITSNIPGSCIYNVFYSQLVRLHRVCNSLDTFEVALKKLWTRIKEKGGKNNKLIRYLTKFVRGNDIRYKVSVGRLLVKLNQ